MRDCCTMWAQDGHKEQALFFPLPPAPTRIFAGLLPCKKQRCNASSFPLRDSAELGIGIVGVVVLVPNPSACLSDCVVASQPASHRGGNGRSSAARRMGGKHPSFHHVDEQSAGHATVRRRSFPQLPSSGSVSRLLFSVSVTFSSTESIAVESRGGDASAAAEQQIRNSRRKTISVAVVPPGNCPCGDTAMVDVGQRRLCFTSISHFPQQQCPGRISQQK